MIVRQIGGPTTLDPSKRRRISNPPQDKASNRVVGTRQAPGACAHFGYIRIGPCIGTGLTGSGDSVKLPDQFTRLRVVRGDVAIVTDVARAPRDHLSLDDERTR